MIQYLEKLVENIETYKILISLLNYWKQLEMLQTSLSIILKLLLI